MVDQGESLERLRKEYDGPALRRCDLLREPHEQLANWLREAIAARLPDPNALVLATATPEAVPSARVVLLRGLDATGLTFYTHYESRKGEELAANPQAAACLLWAPLHRQVRILGPVRRLPATDSDAYFDGRPRGSRLGAWASPQSRPLRDRQELEGYLAEVETKFAGQEIPRPPFWGGFLLQADEYEFWQGRPSRLHDRFRYRRDPAAPEDTVWKIERLAP